MIFIPVSRDQLIPGLLEGRGDIIVAGLTITPERQELVDFSLPVSKPVKEILVTGPSAPEINSLDDLSGQSIHIRKTSSYYSSLMDLSSRLESKGKVALDIQPISELLEDEDLLEMVSAGLLRWIVVDDYKAEIFKDVFTGLVVRDDLVVREGGHLAYAFRKDSPKFATALNEFVKGHKAGTLFGNILVNRYIRDFDWVDNALDTEDYGRLEDVVDIFKKYGDQYGMDYLLVAAHEVGREPVQYVANIYKYYITYGMATVQMTVRAEERKLQGIE